MIRQGMVRRDGVRLGMARYGMVGLARLGEVG